MKNKIEIEMRKQHHLLLEILKHPPPPTLNDILLYFSGVLNSRKTKQHSQIRRLQETFNHYL